MNTVKLSSELLESIDQDGDTESLPSDSTDDSESYSGQRISTDDHPGLLKFDFSLYSEMSKRHSCMYSVALNKVYIDMNRILPVQFYWQFNKADSMGLKNLRVRAFLIFVSPECRHLAIRRCPICVTQDVPSSMCYFIRNNFEQAKHIIWCEQTDAIYEKNADNPWYSVVTVHNYDPSSLHRSYDVLYKFMCKSSCSMSFNRRPVYVMFTLETAQGLVLGRKKLGLKVCRWPKRDMLKEEALEKKRLNGIPIKITKTKNDNINNVDNRTFQIPKLTIPSKKLYMSTLELLHSHFLGSAIRDDNLLNSHPLITMVADLISKENSNNADSKNQQSSYQT